MGREDLKVQVSGPLGRSCAVFTVGPRIPRMSPDTRGHPRDRAATCGQPSLEVGWPWWEGEVTEGLISTAAGKALRLLADVWAVLEFRFGLLIGLCSLTSSVFSAALWPNEICVPILDTIAVACL